MMLGEALVRAGGIGARYRTIFENNGFVSTVESRVPRRCHPRCSGVLHARSHVCGSVSQAKKDVAACLIRTLQWCFVVVVGDANWRRVYCMRRQAVELQVTMQTAHREKQEVVQKARRLEHGWMMTIDDPVKNCIP
jgi:hypothetical protein